MSKQDLQSGNKGTNSTQLAGDKASVVSGDPRSTTSGSERSSIQIPGANK